MVNAAKKQKPVWGDALVALVILAASALLLFAVLPQDEGEVTALVTVDGAEVWTCPLKDLANPISYTVDGEYPLMLEVSKDGVWVVETSCPGEDCRHTGLIAKAGQQIVCLPNRTVVTLQADNLSYDAVTG